MLTGLVSVLRSLPFASTPAWSRSTLTLSKQGGAQNKSGARLGRLGMVARTHSRRGDSDRLQLQTIAASVGLRPLQAPV